MAVLVTGVTGQLGWYVAEALVGSGRVVWGTQGPSGRPLPEGVRDAGPLDPASAPAPPARVAGAGKAAAHVYVQSLREGRGAQASNAIFYVAESERRPKSFVFAKVTRGLAEVALGRAPSLTLGNTHAVRDFYHARDAASAVLRL